MSRSEVRRHAATRELKAGIEDRRLHALAGLSHRRRTETDDVERRQTVSDVDFYADRASVDSVDRKAMCSGKHCENQQINTLGRNCPIRPPIAGVLTWLLQFRGSSSFAAVANARTVAGVPRSSPTLALGRAGERLAILHYERLGATVLERNYRTPSGELDLVVAHRGAVIFVEVKTRTTGGMHPFDSITYAKCSRLRGLASSWLAEHPRHASEIRFDAVGIVMSHQGEFVSLEQCEIMI